MPKAEEGNRTKSGKIEHLQSNVASANKWCKCRQVATEGQCGQREEMRLKIAHTHTHTHFQVQGQEKGVSENEAPGPVGAYTTTHLGSTGTFLLDTEDDRA